MRHNLRIDNIVLPVFRQILLKHISISELRRDFTQSLNAANGTDAALRQTCQIFVLVTHKTSECEDVLEARYDGTYS